MQLPRRKIHLLLLKQYTIHFICCMNITCQDLASYRVSLSGGFTSLLGLVVRCGWAWVGPKGAFGGERGNSGGQEVCDSFSGRLGGSVHSSSHVVSGTVSCCLYFCADVGCCNGTACLHTPQCRTVGHARCLLFTTSLWTAVIFCRCLREVCGR